MKKKASILLPLFVTKEAEKGAFYLNLKSWLIKKLEPFHSMFNLNNHLHINGDLRRQD